MELLSEQLVKALGWSILHSLWYGALAFVLLFTVLGIMPKLNAKNRHNLALLALVTVFFGFISTFGYLIQITPRNLSTQQIQYFAFQLVPPGNLSVYAKMEHAFPIVAGIYLAGIILQGLVNFYGYNKIKSLKNAAHIAIPSHWQHVFSQAMHKLGIDKKVGFFLSHKVNVPLVIGFFKPVVLFPLAMANQLDITQVEAILIHELSHIRRNDYLINLFKTIIETLLFFNPFVWLISQKLQTERENACDDLVVAFTDTPINYAHALLKLEMMQQKEAPALSLGATGRSKHLYQRIKRITNMKTNRTNFMQKSLILLTAIGVATCIAWINPSEKQSKTTKKIYTKTESKNISFALDTDSTNIKEKVSIIITDKNGKQKTYNSFDALPNRLKKRAIPAGTKSILLKDSLAKLASDFNHKADTTALRREMESLKKHFGENFKTADFEANVEKMKLQLRKKYNSPEWKDKIAKMEARAKTMGEKFNSPEWKNKIAKMEARTKTMGEKFNSPEWKDKIAKMESRAKAMENLAKHFEQNFNNEDFKANVEKFSKEIEEKFNSPEWKIKTDDWIKEGEKMKNFHQSKEYQKLRKKYQEDLQQLKKKSGITQNTFNLDYFLPIDIV